VEFGANAGSLLAHGNSHKGSKNNDDLHRRT
jgi:hypothetical protein